MTLFHVSCVSMAGHSGLAGSIFGGKQRNDRLYVCTYITIGINHGISDVVIDFDRGAHRIKNPTFWHHANKMCSKQSQAV